MSKIPLLLPISLTKNLNLSGVMAGASSQWINALSDARNTIHRKLRSLCRSVFE